MWSGIASSWRHHLVDLVAVAGALDLGEVEREQVAGDQLGQEALGRRDADLGPGVGVDDGVGLARDRRAVGVADRQHLRPLGPRVPDRLQRVGGLARLADRDDERGVVEDRVAVAELGGELDLDRHPGPVLDGVLRDHAGVERRAARDDDDLVDVAQLLVGEPHLVEVQVPLRRTTPQQRVGDGARLLVDLLAHEPVVAVLLGGRQVPVDVVAATLGGRAVEVHDGDPVAGDRHDLVLAELQRLAGVLDERRDVGPEEVLALADADHQRRVAARGHHPVGSCASTATRVKAPSSWATTRSIAAVRSTPDSTCSSSSWAATSVSVSESSTWSSASIRARSSAKFSMIPLCTSATRRSPPLCGCALTSFGAPWVAQRVWPMPIVAGGERASRRSPSRGWRACRPASRSRAGRRRRARSRPSRSRGTPAAAGPRSRRPGPASARRTRRSRTWAPL